MSTTHATSTEPHLKAPAVQLRSTRKAHLSVSRRCGGGGGCPYSLVQLLSVLTALRYHGRAEAGKLATYAELPASATYGCLLETEDYGLSRWIARPVHLADHQTAEITLAGVRFLREINIGGRD